MKKCRLCNIEKPLDNFYANNANKDKKDSRCKDCMREVQREWKSNNKNYVKQRDAIYRKAKIKERREYNKKWRAKNKERFDEWTARHIEENRELYRNKTRRRRATLSNCETFVIIPKDLKRLYNSPCAICGSKENITMDHVIPISRGGRHSIGNLQPLCGSCNSSKRDRLMVEINHAII